MLLLVLAYLYLTSYTILRILTFTLSSIYASSIESTYSFIYYNSITIVGILLSVDYRNVEESITNLAIKKL